MAVNAKLDGLEEKLRLLLDRHAALLAENNQLKQQLAELHKREVGRDQPEPAGRATDTTAQRRVLEECIGEIDRCLDWLRHQ